MVQKNWNSHPCKMGCGTKRCRICNNSHGVIRKYGLMICRRCIRDKAKDIGFKKLN